MTTGAGTDVDVVAWLLDSDPAIRWQVMRDLMHAPDDAVAAERARVATEGWGARLLALQGPDGHWSRDAPTFTSAAWADWWRSMPPERRGTLFPAWTSTAWTLDLLRNLGIDPACAGARRAVARVRENCRWEHDGEPFFEGGVEPCINSRSVAIGACFGEDVEPIVARLLGQQVELRAGERIDAGVVPHHDRSAGGSSGVRASGGERPGRDRCPPPRPGVPP